MVEIGTLDLYKIEGYVKCECNESQKAINTLIIFFREYPIQLICLYTILHLLIGQS